MENNTTALMSAYSEAISNLGFIDCDEIAVASEIMKSTISEILNANREFCDAMSDITSGVAESLKNLASLSEELLKIQADTINLSLGAILQTSADILNEVKGSEDYVMVDEKPIRELEIPEAITISIGQNRLKLKTEFLVSLLVTIFFGLVSLVTTIYYENKSSESEEKYRQEQLLVEREENQILLDIRNSIDTSSSSQKESLDEMLGSIDSLQELLQSLELNLQEYHSDPDAPPKSQNSNLE